MCAWPKNVGTTSTSTEESKGASYDTLLKSPETEQTYLQCVLRSINTYIFLINVLKKEMLRQDQPCSALTNGDMYTVCVWRLCTIGMTSEYKTTNKPLDVIPLMHSRDLICPLSYLCIRQVPQWAIRRRKEEKHEPSGEQHLPFEVVFLLGSSFSVTWLVK